ncbi:hypothetical protein [Pseudoduganella sp. UC29_71]|uniref:hypothetical protein n=1 Tax=Pseudoduganella sp. UC29_71 TaxID=3350174 RepID=UPI00366A8BAF
MGRIAAELRKPASWQDFDRLSRSLMSAVHGVQFERWGPADHRQHGADAWARLPNGKVLVLQCKGRSRSFGKSLSIANLDAAVRELDTFPHPVEELIILTTTPETVALQDRAEELTEQRAKAGLSRVSLHGWYSIGELISRHEAVLAGQLQTRLGRRARWLLLLAMAALLASAALASRFS